MTEAKRQHPGVTICPVCTRRIIGKHKCNKPPELPWEEREESEHNDVLPPEKRKTDSSGKSSGELGQSDQAGRMEEAIRQARKPGHQPATAHPWRHQKPGESEPGEPIHKSIGEDGEPQPRSSRDVGAWAPTWRASRHLYGARSIAFSGFDERFDQPVSPVVQHVKDGRPLTERGAELLTVHEADAVGSHGLQGCGRNTAQKAALYPQDIVVSPSSNPLHSQQTKQVHQYQQRKQV